MALRGKTPDQMYAKRDAMRKAVADNLKDFFENPYHFSEEGDDGYSLNDFNESMYDEYGEEFDEDNEIDNIYANYFKANGYDPAKITRHVTPSQLGIGEQWPKFMKKGYYDKHPGAKYRLQQAFTPTKETIWNDPKHVLYGISPSEQNEKFLSDAIKELERNTQSPAHFKYYAKGSGGTMAEARKQLARYKKALEYIKEFGGK